MIRVLSGLLAVCVLGSVEARAADRAAELYKFCATCHGDKGEGRKIGELSLPAIAGLFAWYTEAQLTKFKNGHRGAHPNDSKGLLMRPMARTLTSKEDVKLIAAYVESLPRKKSDKRVKGDLVRGKYYYTSICMSCHGEKFEGNSDPSVAAPSHRPLDDWYMVEQLQKFQSGIRGANGKDTTGARMRPIIKDVLPQLAQSRKSTTDEAMRDVVAYIYSKRE